MSRRVLDHVPESWNGRCPDCGGFGILRSDGRQEIWCDCLPRKPDERSRNTVIDFGERLLAKLKSRKVWVDYYASDADVAKHAAVREALDAVASDIEEVLTELKTGT